MIKICQEGRKKHMSNIDIYRQASAVHIHNNCESGQLYKHQFSYENTKRAHSPEWEWPLCNYKSSIKIITVRLKFHGLCQLIDLI